jgi:acyl-[acyl carrier protein]--UDP-N-acetylglucosamine O-acyltransferase
MSTKSDAIAKAMRLANANIDKIKEPVAVSEGDADPDIYPVILNKKIGRWTIIGNAIKISATKCEQQQIRVPVRCECGTETTVFYHALKNNRSRQCVNCGNKLKRKRKLI